MAKNLRKAGWDHDKRGPICEECVKKDRKVAKEPTVTKVDPINPKLQRKVFGLLDDHFDEEKRVYGSGWSDQRVADEAGTSIAFVESLRRGAYGELAEDPAVTALRGEIASIAAELKASEDTLLSRYADLDKRVGDLVRRLDGLAGKRISRYADLDKRVGDLVRRLDGLAGKRMAG